MRTMTVTATVIGKHLMAAFTDPVEPDAKRCGSTGQDAAQHLGLPVSQGVSFMESEKKTGKRLGQPGHRYIKRADTVYRPPKRIRMQDIAFS